MLSCLRPSLVNLQQINFQDTRFSLSPEEAPTPAPNLLRSIKRTGILHPPILKEEETALFTIVTGRRRLLAAQEVLKIISATCLVIPKKTEEREILAISLEDTLLRGNMTPIEQAIFFDKILAHMDETEAATLFLPALDLEPHPRNLARLLDLLKLEEHLQLAVHNGLLHEGVARDLVRCSFTDRMSLFEVIEMLHLSVSNQKKLAAACHELAIRHNTSTMALLGDTAVREILTHPEANPPQKAANLMQWLASRLSPRLAEAEKEFRRFSAGLQLPRGSKVEHALSFERDTVTLTLPFKNQEALQKVWPELKALLQNK